MQLIQSGPHNMAFFSGRLGLVLLLSTVLSPSIAKPQYSSTVIVRNGARAWFFQGDVTGIALAIGPVDEDLPVDILNNFDGNDEYNKRMIRFFLSFIRRDLVVESNDDGISPSTSAPKASSTSRRTPESRATEMVVTDIPTTQRKRSIGPIGVDTTVENHCIFYNDFSYSCKTGCTSNDDEPIVKEFPENPEKKYYILNCLDDVPDLESMQWELSDGLIDKSLVRPSQSKEVVATCAFYHTRWYECFDVADCTRGVNQCRGGTPWRGYYDGTPEKGITGNITARSMPNGQSVMRLPPKSIPSSGVPSIPKRTLSYSCDIEVSDEVDRKCFRLRKKCRAHGRSCTFSRVLMRRGSNENPDVFQAIQEVINTIQRVPNRSINTTCNIYDNQDICCDFRDYPSEGMEDLFEQFSSHCPDNGF